MSKREMLIYVDTRGNNNKFYELTELPSGVQVRYGRVGSEGTVRVYNGYDAYESKRGEKLRKGYVPFAGAAPSTTSTDKGADAEKSVLTGLFGKETPAATALTKALVANNRHSISLVTGGKITVSDSGAVTTALGPVTAAQLAEAQRILDTIAAAIPPASAASPADTSRYLTLIPQRIANLSALDKWLTPSWVNEQRDLLDALRTALTLNAPSGPSDAHVEAMKARHTLTEVAKGSKVFKEIVRRFQESSNTMHTAAAYKPVRVWEVTDANSAQWDTLMEDRKWHRTLWHGTTAGNVLSILRTGLICPPTSDKRYAASGRMFGDGIYFSDQSTKSLNYAVGAWSRDTGSGNPMMFLSDVAMGREYRTTAADSPSSAVRAAHNGKDHKGREHTSLFVRAGSCGVRNNEMIVWDSAAVKITYLVEFSR